MLIASDVMMKFLAQNNFLQIALDQSFSAVLITDACLEDGGPFIQYCNPAFCRMTGYDLAALQGQSPRILQGPNTDRTVIDSLRTALHQGVFWQGQTVNYKKDGQPYFVEWNISPVKDSTGKISHFISIQQDLTSKIHAEQERDLMVQALNAAQDPILIADQHARIVFVNSAFEKLTGYPSSEILGETPRLLQSGNHDPIFYRDLWKKLSQGQGFRATFMNRRKNGQIFYAEQSIAPLKDKQGNITHFVSIAKDISDIVEREKTLSELAHHDQLTGLLNRHAGERLLQTQLQQLEQDHHHCFCLIVCDIDFFKQINDQHGHITGDRVIQEVAHTMNQFARQTDAVIRWGGDEFVLIIDAPLQVAFKLAERIRRTVNQMPDYQVGKLSMSFGLAEAKAGETMTDLFARADAALYQAKQQGRNCVVSA